MSDYSEPDQIPDDIRETARTIQLSSLPDKSKLRYTAQYNAFKIWRKTKHTSSFAEEILLVYFSEMNCSPPTLFSRYSMLRACILAYDDLNISTYKKLNAFLKKKNDGYTPKKSKVLTSDDISRFCNECVDPNWLVIKAACIIGVLGACRRDELTTLRMNQVEDHNTMLLVRLPITKTKIERSFTVVGDLYNICKMYMDLRKKVRGTDRFFLRMSNGKCENRPIGMNTIGAMPKQIATFLKLPDAARYTGHCFRRTSATLLVDGGADITTLKRHTGHKSNAVAEGYIENSIQNKRKIGETITKSINITSPICSKKRRQNIHTHAVIDHNQPSTSTGIRHEQPHIIPDTQTSVTEDDEIASVQKFSQDFDNDFASDVVQVGTQHLEPTFKSTTVQKDCNNSQLLSNLLNLNKNVTIELNNCYNITFNLVQKKD